MHRLYRDARLRLKGRGDAVSVRLSVPGFDPSAEDPWEIGRLVEPDEILLDGHSLYHAARRILDLTWTAADDETKAMVRRRLGNLLLPKGPVRERFGQALDMLADLELPRDASAGLRLRLEFAGDHVDKLRSTPWEFAEVMVGGEKSMMLGLDDRVSIMRSPGL